MIIRAGFLIFLLLVIYILSAFLNPIPKKNTVEGFKPRYGVSYSFEQAGWYGLDPKKSYIELLSAAKFDWVRLPFFWDQMVDENGIFNKNFEDLEFAVKEAKIRNIKVVIVVGAKTPYYPEYHLPDRIKSQLKFGDTITANHPVAKDILAIDKKVGEALSAHDNIAFWQVENEPFLANVNNWKIDESLVRAEVETIRSADSKHRPIILNHVGPSAFDKKYRRLLDILKPGDVLGVNAYFKTQGVHLASFKIGAKEIRIPWPKWLVWPVQSWFLLSPDYEGLKNEVGAKSIKLWVLEMQAEPYVRTLNDANAASFAFCPQDILAGDQFLKSSKVESVGLWGAPFWQFRLAHSDNSWLESVRKTVDR